MKTEQHVKKYEDFVNESKTTENLNESSLSKVWSYVQNPEKPFGIVSASRNIYNDIQNADRHRRLKLLVKDGAYLDIETNKLVTKEESKSIKRIRKIFDGYGYVELDGGFVEGDDIIVNEKSLFIPNISEEDIISLGVEFEQDSIIYKNSEKFVMLGTSQVYGVGVILDIYKKNDWRNNITLAEEDVKMFFSMLAKGSHKGIKFAFNSDGVKEEYLYEYRRLSSTDVKLGKPYGRENSIKLL